MNHGQLTRAIARELFLPKTEAGAIIDFALSKIKDNLKAGRRVYFRGFGSATKKIRPRRRVRHPRTGRIIWIPARAVVDFNASPQLLKAIKRR